MKRLSIVGLCLAAVCVFSAGAASSASAEELLFKAETGNIVGGEFLSSGGLSVLRSVGGQTVHCKEVRNNGKFLSTTLGDLLIRFLGCTTVAFGSTVSCTTSGAGTGEIHLPSTTTLFHLGLAHLGANTSIPAIDILLDEAVKFKCSISTVTVKGDVIGALQLANGNQVPLNEPVAAATLVFKESAQGKQELKEFLMPNGGLVTQHLTSTILAEEESGETSTDTLDGFTNSTGAATNILLVEP